MTKKIVKNEKAKPAGRMKKVELCFVCTRPIEDVKERVIHRHHVSINSGEGNKSKVITSLVTHEKCKEKIWLTTMN